MWYIVGFVVRWFISVPIFGLNVVYCRFCSALVISVPIFGLNVVYCRFCSALAHICPNIWSKCGIL